MKQEKLDKILVLHEKYLKGEKHGKCANLRGADLRRVNLYGADLRGADLRNANLWGANLCDANLCDANLRGADLRRVNLYGADLWGADLRNANLWSADLRDVSLQAANLRNANLQSANLWSATLWGADLCSANLRNSNLRNATLWDADLFDADLCDANLYNADLRDAKNIPFLPQTIVCPEKGSFIGFKKVNRFIVELEIPSEAKRSSATTRKCRCEFAKVLSITNIYGTDSGFNEITNTKYGECVYKIGEIVYPDSFDNDRWNECSYGIHFFITRQEAVEY